MNIITIILGAFCIGYGFFTIIMRIKSPEKFAKLNAMKNKYGEKRGKIIHIIFYSVIPILGGVVFLVSDFLGVSVF